MKTEYQTIYELNEQVKSYIDLIKRIQDVLNTEETGEALIEVARNAHRAELELASTINFDDEEFPHVS